MSLGHGPRLVTQGLVFAYDMPTNGASSTNKSWKGAPVTNVVANTDLDTGWSQNYNTSIQWNDYPAPNGINSQVVSFIDADGNGSGYWYSYGDYATQQPDTTYAISIWCRTIGSDWTIRAYTADNSETGRQNTNNVTIPGDGKWHRAEFNPITTPSNTQSDSLSFIFPSIPPGQRCWLCAPQMTATSYHVPFVNGTRSNTQSLIDWTGNGATITMNSPTYNNNGTFGFNGGTERIDLTNIGGTLAFNNHFTISAWINSTDISATQNILSMNGPYFMRLYQSKVRFNVYAGSSPSWLFQNGSTVLSSNTWYFLTMVWDGTANTWTGYINNQQEFSVSKTGPLFGSTNNKTFYGYVGYTPQGGEQSNFQGQIPAVYYYNRALTATEVAQNFNALKGRYGL